MRNSDQNKQHLVEGGSTERIPEHQFGRNTFLLIKSLGADFLEVFLLVSSTGQEFFYAY